MLFVPSLINLPLDYIIRHCDGVSKICLNLLKLLKFASWTSLKIKTVTVVHFMFLFLIFICFVIISARIDIERTAKKGHVDLVRN